MSEVNMDDVEDVLKAAKEKKIELPQKNTVREFDRWRKEITEATNANAEAIAELETRTNVTHAANVRDKLWKQINDNAKAIELHDQSLNAATNAYSKLKKRVEQLEDIKDGLELDKELHQGTSTTIPLDKYAEKREQPDIQQEGFYRCHDCGHGPFAITEKVCDSCGGEAFDFIPDKPAQQEGHWECEECGDRPEMSPAIRITTHMRCKSCDNWPVRWVPSPTETPEAEEPDLEAIRDGACDQEPYGIYDAYEAIIGKKNKEIELLKRLMREAAMSFDDPGGHVSLIREMKAASDSQP